MTDAVVSQVAVEVIRPNSGLGVAAEAGAFSVSGQAASLPNATKAYTLTGNAATLTYTPDLRLFGGDFSLTGISAALTLNKVMASSAGSFDLTGQNAATTLRRSGGSVLLVGL